MQYLKEYQNEFMFSEIGAGDAIKTSGGEKAEQMDVSAT